MNPAPKPTYDLALASADYPPRDGLPDRTILVCSHPRSGSTLLGEILYFAGGLGCPLEYFHTGFRPGFAERWQAPDMASLITATRRHRTDASGVFSSKLFWRDIEDLMRELAPSLADAFIDQRAEHVPPSAYRQLHAFLCALFPNPTFIHLKRLDRVRLAISALTAVQTQQWRAIPGQGSTRPESNGAKAEVEYDYERIASLIAYADHCHAHWERYFSVNMIGPHALTYEQLARQDRQPLIQLLQHLGHQGELPAIRMQRQADARSEKFVARFLADHFRGKVAQE